ncbi:MAG TPA: hypothetical protein VGN52_25430 [Burkholderiales bacterium]|jgi:antitoxin component YwqK of YwqJK toxin-antitoxin module
MSILSRSLFALLAWACVFLSPAYAQPLRCELNGESINPNNGNTTAGKTGLMRCRTEDGALQREEELRNGKYVGKRVFYGRDGRKEQTVNEKGNLDGLVREFYPGGKLKEEGQYSNGDRTGVYKRYYESGQLERVAYAVLHKGSGERDASLEYTEDGKLRGLQCGTHSLMPEDRAPCGFAGAASKVDLYRTARGSVRVDTRVSYLDGVAIERISFDDNNQPARSYSFKDGIETTREYFPDGKPRRERAFAKNGDARGRDGVEREWASNGQMLREVRYAGGYETATTVWYMNGSMKQKRSVEGSGRNALAHVEDYFDSGKLEQRGDERGGRGVGKHQSFDEAGTLREEAGYDDTGVLKTRRVYDAHGKLTADDEFFEDGSRKRKLP